MTGHIEDARGQDIDLGLPTLTPPDHGKVTFTLDPGFVGAVICFGGTYHLLDVTHDGPITPIAPPVYRAMAVTMLRGIADRIESQ